MEDKWDVRIGRVGKKEHELVANMFENLIKETQNILSVGKKEAFVFVFMNIGTIIHERLTGEEFNVIIKLLKMDRDEYKDLVERMIIKDGK